MSFSKFLDPKVDFAFKRIFGRETNKDILISFLNDMLNHLSILVTKMILMMQQEYVRL